MRFGILVVVACGGAAPRGATSADLARHEQAARQHNAASFAARLAAMQLAPVEIPSMRDVLGEGLALDTSINPAGPSHPPRPVGELFERDGQRFVAGPVAWTLAGTAPPAWEFVRDTTGAIFKVERRPRVVATQRIEMPGCQHEQWGSGCPACGTTDQIFYGPLPAGAEYKGPIEIAYDEHRVETHWRRGMCNDPPPP